MTDNDDGIVLAELSSRYQQAKEALDELGELIQSAENDTDLDLSSATDVLAVLASAVEDMELITQDDDYEEGDY